MTKKNETLVLDLLGRLYTIKLDHPELRIGQIISNALTPSTKGDPYYVTDEALAQGLKDFEGLIKMLKKGKKDG